MSDFEMWVVYKGSSRTFCPPPPVSGYGAGSGRLARQGEATPVIPGHTPLTRFACARPFRFAKGAWVAEMICEIWPRPDGVARN